MKILVKAKTHARTEKVELLTQLSFGFGSAPELPSYRVSVNVPPEDGKANEAIIRLLAEHFTTKAYNVRIISGHTSTQKVVEIDL